jgi:quercetin dioxygenase-like cupin family protein
MKIFRSSRVPINAADPATFTGLARVKRLVEEESEDETPVGVYRVVFSDGARTHWHKHSGPQWLFVVEGRIRAQVLGEEVQDVDAGDAIVFAPNEKHWHGAVPGHSGTHLAVNINVKTEWLEAVTDDDYYR